MDKQHKALIDEEARIEAELENDVAQIEQVYF